MKDLRTACAAISPDFRGVLDWSPRDVSRALRAAAKAGMQPNGAKFENGALLLDFANNSPMTNAIKGPDDREYLKVRAPNGCEWWFDDELRNCANPFITPEPDEVWHHRLADQIAAHTPAKCYFIGGDFDRVKIGYAADVRSRLTQLQTACPFKLRVLAVARGGACRESAYHSQFAEERLHGEWFRRSQRIESEMLRLNTRPRPAERGAMPSECCAFERSRSEWQGEING